MSSRVKQPVAVDSEHSLRSLGKDLVVAGVGDLVWVLFLVLVLMILRKVFELWLCWLHSPHLCYWTWIGYCCCCCY